MIRRIAPWLAMIVVMLVDQSVMAQLPADVGWAFSASNPANPIFQQPPSGGPMVYQTAEERAQGIKEAGWISAVGCMLMTGGCLLFALWPDRGRGWFSKALIKQRCGEATLYWCVAGAPTLFFAVLCLLI